MRAAHGATSILPPQTMHHKLFVIPRRAPNVACHPGTEFLQPCAAMVHHITLFKLKPGPVSVIINARSGARKLETRWNFFIDPGAKASGTAGGDALPPRPAKR